MDLFELKDVRGRRYLCVNVLDLASRLQLAQPVRKKTPEAVLKRFLEVFVTPYGAPSIDNN